MRKLRLTYRLAGLALIIINIAGYGQVSEDSIDAVIERLPDSEKLHHLFNAAVSFESSSLSKALKYADQRLEVSRKLNNPNHIATTYNLYGNLYLESGLYANAEKNYRIAYEMFDSLGNYEGLATECHNLGLVYYNRGDTLNSLNYYKESVLVRKSTGNARRIGDGLTTLGEAYLKYKDYDQSIKALYEALEYYGDTTSYPRKIDCLAFIADNLNIKSPDKALQWINEMEKENELLGRRSYDQMIKLRYAAYYLATGDLERSANYLDMINTDSIFLYEVISPVTIYLEMSKKLLESGDTRNGLNYSMTARNIHRRQESHHTADMTSEFKTRLNLRIADEELKAINEINRLMLQRIKIEEYIKYFMILAVIILSLMGLRFMISLLSIRHNAAVLKVRRNELEEAYERSLKYKEKILTTRENKNVFFKMISGKLDQPFRVLMNELERLSEMTSKSVVRDRFIAKLEDILFIGGSIERSLKRVLLWSKLQRNKYEVHKTEIVLSDYLHELLPEILSLTIRKDIRVRYDIDPGIIINFDRHSLKTILRILVENSVEYSDPKSDLIIRAQESRSGAVLSVTDSGSGIPEWLKENIFNIDRDNVNADSTHKPGIGLLIARQMAEINDASISFESPATKGTTFFIHITKTDG